MRRRPSYSSLALVAVAALLVLFAPSAPPVRAAVPTHAMPVRGGSLHQPWASAGEPITFHGGAVMTGHVAVYVVWYGSWPARSKRRTVVTDFLQHLPSPYWAINQTFPSASGRTVGNDIALAAQVDDAYSRGRSRLSDDDIQSVVTSAIASHALPKDVHGVYLVLTSADVTKTGFLTEYCGWHSYVKVGGTSIKFSFVGDPTGPKVVVCSPQAATPNGDRGADAMASTIAHELSETVTDPTMGGWRTRHGEENADRCAWQYGTVYRVHGTAANVHLGSRDYLLQTNWVNSAVPHCGLA